MPETDQPYKQTNKSMSSGCRKHDFTQENLKFETENVAVDCIAETKAFNLNPKIYFERFIDALTLISSSTPSSSLSLHI